jgi:predicted DNA-binding protein YlxM (UPF0122 family)
MFTQYLDKMTEKQRSKIRQLLNRNASLEEILSEPEVVNQSKWETQASFKN